MTMTPRVQAALAFIVFIAVGVSQGAVHLTNLIPEAWIPTATAYCGFIAFIGAGLTAGTAGVSLTTSSRLSGAAQVEGVKSIQVDPKIADVAKAAVGTDATITTKP